MTPNQIPMPQKNETGLNINKNSTESLELFF